MLLLGSIVILLLVLLLVGYELLLLVLLLVVLLILSIKHLPIFWLFSITNLRIISNLQIVQLSDIKEQLLQFYPQTKKYGNVYSSFF